MTLRTPLASLRSAPLRPARSPSQIAQVRRQGVYALLDLLEQVRNILVVKRQRPAQQRVEDHSAGPNIDLGAGVQVPGNHLRGRVVGGAARGAEEFAVFHNVRKTKVGYFHVEGRVEDEVLCGWNECGGVGIRSADTGVCAGVCAGVGAGAVSPLASNPGEQSSKSGNIPHH